MSGGGPPLIGLTGRRLKGERIKDFPEPLQGCQIDTFIGNYSVAIAAAGGIPVLLTPDAPVASMLERLDGVLLAGGADIDPQCYDAEPEPELGPIEPERDAFEMAIYEHVMAAEMPLLGVCRGLQLVNVAAGGTLHQHILDHRSGERPVTDEIHMVRIEPGTTLAGLYASETRGVNSLHHQAVDRLADDYLCTAMSDEGYAEAIEHKRLPVLAVQWHPELMASAEEDPLFGWLIDSARSWAAQRA